MRLPVTTISCTCAKAGAADALKMTAVAAIKALRMEHLFYRAGRAAYFHGL
jgi:hypothetical protein